MNAPIRGQQSLDAHALARLQSLGVRVRHVVDGTLAGIHPSPHHGSSVEFAEHKEYSLGDDLRKLDWKVLARRDRYYVRQYENESELTMNILLDASASMSYGAPLSKFDYASILAAALASLTVRQRDRVSLTLVSDKIDISVPAFSQANKIHHILTILEQHTPRGTTNLPAGLRAIGSHRRRGIVMVMSDFFTDVAVCFKQLRQLRARGSTVMIVHLLHEDELTFPFQDYARFTALETPRHVFIDPDGYRRLYLNKIRQFCDDLSGLCRESRIGYQRASTQDAADLVLSETIRELSVV